MTANTVFNDAFVDGICCAMVSNKDGFRWSSGRCAGMGIGKELTNSGTGIACWNSCVTTSGNDGWYGGWVGNMSVGGTVIIVVVGMRSGGVCVGNTASCFL